MHGIGGLEQLSGSLLLAGRDGRVDDLALSRLRSPAVFRSIPDSERNPVTAGEAEFGLAHVLQHAAGLLDGTNAALTVPITCSRSACDTRRYRRSAADAASSSPGPVTIAAR